MPDNEILFKLKADLEALDKYDKDDQNRKAILNTVWTIGKEVYFFTRETGWQIKDVAEELEAPAGSLQKFVRFYKCYPEGYADEFNGKTIAWSHYTAVLYVRNKEARDFYIQAAAAEEWSSHELRRRIRNNYYENKRAEAPGPGQTAVHLREKIQQLYTYSAEVERVIDGDTLKLQIDVGFNTRMRHTVRLRGIDCPESGTVKGEAAAQFVEQTLNSPSRTMGGEGEGDAFPIVVKTYKSDKFGRYLVDVWYLPGENDPEEILKRGRLLNQVLLDAGLAMKVE